MLFDDLTIIEFDPELRQNSSLEIENTIHPKKLMPTVPTFDPAINANVESQPPYSKLGYTCEARSTLLYETMPDENQYLTLSAPLERTIIPGSSIP